MSHADWPHAWPAAAVRNAKSFVEVEVANVRANGSGRGQTNLGVHVCAVHINLSAVLVNERANFFDRFLKNAVCGRIRYHQTSQFVAVLLGFLAQVIKVNVTALVAFRNNYFHARHHCRSGVGSVGRRRNQGNGTVRVATTFVVGSDGHQTCIFALCARIGLQRHGRKTRDFAKPSVEVFKQLLVTFGLFERGKGVHFTKFWPRNGNHLGSSVEFHGAASQRNHRMYQR